MFDEYIKMLLLAAVIKGEKTPILLYILGKQIFSCTIFTELYVINSVNLIGNVTLHALMMPLFLVFNLIMILYKGLCKP